jgi:hypothetical protein
VQGETDGPVVLDGRFAEFHATIPAHATQTVTLTPTAAGTWTTVDDASPSVAFSSAPGWSFTGAADGYVDRTAHYTDARGATAELTFDGTAVQVIGDRAPDHGQLQLYVDGKLQGDLDAWQGSRATQRVVAAVYGLAPGTHTVRLRVVGVHDAQASGSYVGVDAFRVLR